LAAPLWSPFAGGWQSSTFISYETPAATKGRTKGDELCFSIVAADGLPVADQNRNDCEMEEVTCKLDALITGMFVSNTMLAIFVIRVAVTR
jgi:hypothetical protein